MYSQVWQLRWKKWSNNSWKICQETQVMKIQFVNCCDVLFRKWKFQTLLHWTRTTLKKQPSSAIHAWPIFNGPSPGSFLFIFVFSTNKHYNFTTDLCEKCPSSIQYWDLNPQPSAGQSHPITTRPGLQFLKILFHKSSTATKILSCCCIQKAFSDKNDKVFKLIHS